MGIEDYIAFIALFAFLTIIVVGAFFALIEDIPDRED